MNSFALGRTMADIEKESLQARGLLSEYRRLIDGGNVDAQAFNCPAAARAVSDWLEENACPEMAAGYRAMADSLSRS